MKLKQWTKEQHANKVQEIANAPIGDISIEGLIQDGLLVLFREVKNLLATSVNGKLTPADARDLRDHLKLLFELKDRETDFLLNLTEDQLKDKVKYILNGSK